MTTPQFHSLRIREVRPETADAVSVSFEVPPELREQYRFTQGQFVTLKAHVDGEETRRSYSICVGVTDYDRDGELRIGIKRVRGGRFSNFAFDTLQAGHAIDVMTPDGRFFTHLNAEQGKQYVAFAGGSGITPVLAIVKTTLDMEPRSTFTLIYGNRSVDAIMFAEELEDLKNRYMNRFVLYHVLSDDMQDVELFNGVLDQAKCAAFLETLVPAASIDEAFICGPAPMMDAAEAALKAAGVEPSKVHVERFGSPLPQAGAAPVEITEETPAAELEIIIDGKRRKMRLPYEGASLLDVGLHAGLALPYACKGGVCCTCRAKVLEGEVKMDKNYTLEEQEIRDGFVLTCQCHPVSERVVVSYDER
ncbi:1,2-phenylacetyl-CoA epoxidase subunit PaaE [Trinickia soli]|uniref:Phenylacetate-CoA oxygenase/reductase subunit PaaK n=1 Tax=Trinickia soli TaxID=380675 RepID=A0A2N7VKQ4_9BURK|nr:1,2-phenylacetyl-CoA epoxidase subunit PaaE [Trinickia soli]KAA0073431.1 phenylacetate-CoA oxygenase/reductase subunit PaaK [Paraburkholderia sp. T12-10]PMS17740.1 phenylacetate-CoA oxygenase/reductase subunit PaaK [Trinickia soli]CAB3723412.1 1,2-phenylacetyl-CoA epoxidase, subunit E [Trinickia soli]